MEDQKGAPFISQPVCSVGTNDGAQRIGFLSVGQAFDCHLTLASKRDGHKDEAGSVTAAVLPSQGFFAEVETWEIPVGLLTATNVPKAREKSKKEGRQLGAPF